MSYPVSNSTSPTKTIFSGLETGMTSVTDDETQSNLGMPLPAAPPPTGPNTVVGEKLPTADEIGRQLMFSGVFRVVRGTPATSVVTTQDLPKVNVTMAEERGGVLEHTMWPEVVEEQVVQGLRRLAQYAIDRNAENPSKTVQEYYSERLAKLIKQGDIKFDVEHLK